MLTNNEFARINHLPADLELSPEMELFAMFNIDMGDVMNPDGTPAFPELVGKGVDMWSITPRKDGLTMAEMKKVQIEEQKADQKARCEMYAARGYAFDERALTDPNGGEDEWMEEEEEVEEWDEFFHG